MADELKLTIDLDTNSVKSGFKDIEKQSESTTSKLSGAFKQFAATAAAAFTAVKIVNFFQDATREAAQAEKATNALAAALGQIGKFSPQAVGSFNDFASSLQRTTGIQDDVIKQNAALLVSLGNLSGAGLEQATKASLNLAQALQIDVGSAFDLVAKASTGNVTALSRYGIKIDENIPKSQKFATVLELIETRFNGLANTRLNTFEGSLDNLSNAFGEIQEAIGGFIVNSPALRAVINVVSQSLFDLADSITGLAGGDPFGKLISGALEFGKILVAFVIAPVEKFINVTILGVQVLVTAFQGLIALFGKVQNSIVEGLIRPVISGFGFIADKIVSLFDEDLANRVKGNIEGFGSAIGETSQTVADSTAEVFQDSFNSLSASADKAFNTDISESIFGYLDKLQVAATTTSQTAGQIGNSLADLSNKANEEFSALTKSLKSQFVTGVSSAFQTVGQNLQKGQGLFDDFGNSIVGIIGDLAISLGNALIIQGLAIESFIAAITSLFPGSGALAAAAGVGLVIFGSALKASVGAGGSSSPAASTGGGGLASEPGTGTTITQPEQLERQEPQTAVQLIVQGDIFDSDSTATRLTDLLNDAFDKKGVVIQRGAFA